MNLFEEITKPISVLLEEINEYDERLRDMQAESPYDMDFDRLFDADNREPMASEVSVGYLNNLYD